MAIPVVAAILESEGKFLVCQRQAGADFALKWEFPGGKIERGETPEAALERELWEELGIRAKTGRIYDARAIWREDREIILLFYKTALISGAPQPLECNALAWAAPCELANFDFAEADAQIAARLMDNT